MALLAFLVMLASLMTVGVLGFEWAVTSSQSRAYSHHAPTARSETVIQKRKNYQASLEALRKLANSDPTKIAAAATKSEGAETQGAQAQEMTDTVAQEEASDRPRIVRRNKAKLTGQRRKNEITQADLGAGNPIFDSNNVYGHWR